MLSDKTMALGHEDMLNVVNELRKHGLSNGSSLGYHSGTMDLAADFIEMHLQLAKEGKLLYLRYAPGTTLYRICPQGRHVSFGDMRNGRIVNNPCQRCPWCNCDCTSIGYAGDNFSYIIKPVTIKNYRCYLDWLPHFDSVFFETEQQALAYLKGLDADVESIPEEVSP